MYWTSDGLGILSIPRGDGHHLSMKYVDSINVLIHQNKYLRMMSSIIWHYLVLFISNCYKRGVSNVGYRYLQSHIRHINWPALCQGTGFEEVKR